MIGLLRNLIAIPIFHRHCVGTTVQVNFLKTPTNACALYTHWYTIIIVFVFLLNAEIHFSILHSSTREIHLGKPIGISQCYITCMWIQLYNSTFIQYSCQSVAPVSGV